MIRELSGDVIRHEGPGIVINVSGWGVLVSVPNPDAFTAGEHVTLRTHLAVKQDGFDLYGTLVVLQAWEMGRFTFL